MTTSTRYLVLPFLVTFLLASASGVGAQSTTGATPKAEDAIADIGITRLVAIITAIGALGTAAFGLVDATKAFWGGVSNFGLPGILRTAARFSAALDHALGPPSRGRAEWRRVVSSHWINGRPRDEQKAIVKSLIRLGLTSDTAGEDGGGGPPRSAGAPAAAATSAERSAAAR